MDPTRPLSFEALARAAAELSALDPDLGAVVERLGVPPLWDREPGFATLVHIILEQQVSLASARTLFERLHRDIGATPESVASAGVDGLRRFGLTRQKADYVHGLAVRVSNGLLDLGALESAPGDDVERVLIGVRGLGPWTVAIYRLMALRHADIWPPGDLALASSMWDVKRLDALPSRLEQAGVAEAWKPWRSVAARILWMHYLAERGLYPSDTQAN